MTPFTAAALGTPETLTLGLIGDGIGLSRTPAMQEAEGAAHGFRTIYRLFDVAAMTSPPALGDLVSATEQCGYAGLNITFPFKIAVRDHLHALGPEAEMLGAVNTVVFRNARRIGHNTDLGGFSDSFATDMAGAERTTVLQLGAGGAGLAVAFGLMQNGVERLSVFDPHAERATSLVAAVGARFGPDRVRRVETIDGRYDGIVNATPIGTARHPGVPYPVERLNDRMFVADVNYFPLETALVLAAKASGCRAMGGAGMAVGQAVRAFGHFTGLEASPDRMMATFLGLDG
ncbi:shikimate dehydrogenase [Jiella sp. MQZ9-1]|uniref:Shikimate dehydrogenase n=1 Tax=Jiella flava TaxID=2816857 RepID=A0A939FX33_9HYPH|nr:shikimate dehydrogenase [Jiella flava]MBO0663102.1 shikimate dehydrogenase [Jiella flava]MCD2471521.1 shikimate dehydrogenase [Jiella flava]